MAAEAIAADPVVIEVGRRPRIRRVARLAVVVARNVICTLTCRDRAVVAGEASAAYLRVVHPNGRLPGCRRMARFAGVRRGDVRSVLAGRLGTVVTTDAIAGDTAMREASRCPGGG